MCVIIAVQDKRPTEEMLEKGWDANHHGGGIAWREKDKQGNKIVRWSKGHMELKSIKDLCMKVPMPYIVHFRIASVGAQIPELTHPFPVDINTTLQLEGVTKGAVLFHNGTWHSWADKLLETAIMSQNEIPAGPWSDSRAMAWLTKIYGPGFVDILGGQKGVLFHASKNAEVYRGTGWTLVNDIWCSNDSTNYRITKHKTTYGPGRVCSAPHCRAIAISGEDLCYTCKREAEIIREKAGNATANPTNGGSTRMATTTATSQVQVSTALVKTGQQGSGPLDGALSLSEAKELLKVQGITQSDFKKFRKLYSQMNRVVSDKKKSKLIVRLLEHSEKVCQAAAMAHGSTS